MPRPERFVPAGVPVHVTQRGNFRKSVFALDYDYRLFLELLGRYAGEYGNRVVGYCMLPNHFHLVLIPDRDEGVSAMMQVLNSKYARTFNERLERKGHLWQARFGASSMSENHYRTALAYVDLNPVRAGLAGEATSYRWSSAAAHAGLCDYPAYLDRGEFSRMFTVEDWTEILQLEVQAEDAADLRRATHLGAVSGGPEFVREMECKYGRVLERRRPGRPRKEAGRKAAPGD
ncbi:MAG: transposase [Bryobacteraceae bacterium]